MTAEQLDQLGGVKFVVPNLSAPTREAKVMMSCIGFLPKMVRVESVKGNSPNPTYWVSWSFRCTVCGIVKTVAFEPPMGRKGEEFTEIGCAKALSTLEASSADNHWQEKRHKSMLIKYTIPLSSMLGILDDGKSPRYATKYSGRNPFGYTVDGCWYTSCSEQGCPLPTKQTARECLGLGELLLPLGFDCDEGRAGCA